MECKKKKYPNKNQAKKSAIYFKEKFGVKQRAYGCNICGKVHLSTKFYNK